MLDQVRSSPTLRGKTNWLQSVPFIALHLAPLAIFWVGIRWQDLALCAFLYVSRMFFITAGYHRYFAHRSYKLGRVMQFLMAFGGTTSAQKGVLWWAAHHRAHHRHSDTDRDIHSPRHGFWWSHVGWIVCETYNETDYERIRDFAKYPELRWLNRFHVVPPLVLAIVCYLGGGLQALFGGFFLSTVLLYHGTFTINSFTHLWGKRRFATPDDSRNSLIFALITMGEGWHNNHHHYQSTANMGFYWWEVDISYYMLKSLSWVGLARDLRKPPRRVLEQGRSGVGAEHVEERPASEVSLPLTLEGASVGTGGLVQ